MKKKIDFEKEVINFLSKIAKIPKKRIKLNSDIRNELGIDSMMAVELVASIEKKFKIDIDETAIFNIFTVKDVIKLIKKSAK